MEKGVCKIREQCNGTPSQYWDWINSSISGSHHFFFVVIYFLLVVDAGYLDCGPHSGGRELPPNVGQHGKGLEVLREDGSGEN